MALYRDVGSILGEANCIQGLGDVALGLHDESEALRRFEQALALYARIPAPLSMGWAHVRLARLARGEPGLRKAHLDAAHAAWQAIGRLDLVATLDREFSAE